MNKDDFAEPSHDWYNDDNGTKESVDQNSPIWWDSDAVDVLGEKINNREYAWGDHQSDIAED